MYKGNESEGHTKLLRKTKINKSSHDKSRVMLTDLCP